MGRKHKVRGKTPSKFAAKPLPTPDEIIERAAVEVDARAKEHPPAVYVTKIERNNLQSPERGHGVIAYFTTSYRVTDAEVRRAIIRGFRCFKCEDKSWLS